MVHRRLLPLLVLVISLGLAAMRVEAVPATDAVGFINDLVNQALKALNNKQMSVEERETQFRKLLRDGFDVPRISRFVLGRYWNQASDQEKQQFQKLFEDYIVHSYSARFAEYSGETVQVTGSRQESETGAIVMSQIIRPNGGPPTKVDWRVRKEDSGFKIVDVNIEGVSMAITQRDEFSAVIQRGGGTVASLNKTLQDKLASNDASLAAPILPKNQ
jgi:phospholipid transport system substrate-binding protein